MESFPKRQTYINKIINNSCEIILNKIYLPDYQWCNFHKATKSCPFGKTRLFINEIKNKGHIA